MDFLGIGDGVGQTRHRSSGHRENMAEMMGEGGAANPIKLPTRLDEIAREKNVDRAAIGRHHLVLVGGITCSHLIPRGLHVARLAKGQAGTSEAVGYEVMERCNEGIRSHRQSRT